MAAMESKRLGSAALAKPGRPSKTARARIYLDENVPHRVKALLATHRRKAITTSDAQMNGASDPCQLRHAAAMRAVIVTRDMDFVSLHATNKHCGIVKYPADMGPIDVTARLLRILKVVPDINDTLVVVGWQSFTVGCPRGEASSRTYPDLRCLPTRMPPPRQKATVVGKRSGAVRSAPGI